MLKLVTLLTESDHDQVAVAAARWIHRWCWESGFNEAPSPEVVDFLGQFVPTRAVTLCRWERVDHDNRKRTTAPSLELQAWSRDREVISDTVSMMNEDPGEPRAVMLTRRFDPDGIFTDTTLYPPEFMKLVDAAGGHSEMSEVIVYR